MKRGGMIVKSNALLGISRHREVADNNINGGEGGIRASESITCYASATYSAPLFFLYNFCTIFIQDLLP